MRPETIEDLAQTLVRNEVHICLSSLVSTLAVGAHIDFRGMLLARHGTELHDLMDQASELAAPLEDWEGAATEAGWTGPHKDQFGATYYSDETDGQTWACATWEDLCREFDLEPLTRDVYEHWAVSQMLGDDLAAIGEKVDFDFAGLIVWARTTTGQAIYMDSAMYEVARLLRERTEWSRA